MARNRMIKPEFWKDEKTGSLSDRAKLLFIGMLNVADDCGILRYNAPILRSEIFVYCDITKAEIEELMREIEEAELIQVYQAKDDEQKYCIIRNFLKHQQIAKPTNSKLPKPDNFENILREIVEYSVYAEKLLQEDYGSSTVGVQEDYGSSTVGVQEDYGSSTAQKKLKEVKGKEKKEKLKEEKGSEKGKETELVVAPQDPAFSNSQRQETTNDQTATDLGEGERQERKRHKQPTENDTANGGGIGTTMPEGTKSQATTSPPALPSSDIISATSVNTFKERVEYAKRMGIEESIARRLCNFAQSSKFSLSEAHYKGFVGKSEKEVEEAFKLLNFLARRNRSPSGLKRINSS
jgi:hypothetical protein